MKISVEFDTNKDSEKDILLLISKLLGKDSSEARKTITINEARKKVRLLAKQGKIEIAQELVNKCCGGSIEGAPEDSYIKLVSEIDNIIGGNNYNEN